MRCFENFVNHTFGKCCSDKKIMQIKKLNRKFISGSGSIGSDMLQYRFFRSLKIYQIANPLKYNVFPLFP